jgi:hypothetical protein
MPPLLKYETYPRNQCSHGMSPTGNSGHINMRCARLPDMWQWNAAKREDATVDTSDHCGSMTDVLQWTLVSAVAFQRVKCLHFPIFSKNISWRGGSKIFTNRTKKLTRKTVKPEILSKISGLECRSVLEKCGSKERLNRKKGRCHQRYQKLMMTTVACWK